ncbi:hypothetical protein [Tissierella sp. Yu-01]|uniref:hypothetical protein n=1 Tax=Tissierella sp. Yu-01 TaxID=3035694 RepID=UPI00240E5A1C|nr:hypothetical protein [Tissierella sp. Yu-01]WFA10370.1 hypothetical protein P3962_07400 [Tissierella sp. Yu-01]
MGKLVLKGAFRVKHNSTCPLCLSSKHVGRVFTTKSFNNNNVTTRNFCSKCLVEFDNDGVLYPPIY